MCKTQQGRLLLIIWLKVSVKSFLLAVSGAELEHQDPFPTGLSVSFFTFLVQSATSAVTHRPASQQGGARRQYSHISPRQFFHGICVLPFVPKGHGYLSSADH